MIKEFIPYQEALELKELGFDEPCLASWNFYTNKLNYNGHPSTFNSEDVIQLPSFAQAFRWFRGQKVLGLVNPIDDWHHWSFSILAEDCMSPFFEAFQGLEYSTYEEAELACLRKMIEITKHLKGI